MSGREQRTPNARAWLTLSLLFVTTATAAPRFRSVRHPAPPPHIIEVTAEPPACALTPLAQVTCDGAPSLTPSEVDAIVRAAAKSLSDDTLTIAVVDRAGRPLALYRKPSANPLNDDAAVGVARTAAFFSHNMAPLSSRTVRFLSGIHFPPGITNTPSAALYGIENTNRGCDFNVAFNAGKCIPRARRVGGAQCDSSDPSGCSSGIVTGKQLPNDADASSVNAGGIPLYRVSVDGPRVFGGKLLGAIGVAGAGGDSQRAEYAAVTGAFGALATAIAPVPAYPLPNPGNVFIDGIRLPFLGDDLRLTFASNGIPNGVTLKGATAGSDNGAFAIAPQFGGCAADEYLVGPLAGSQLSVLEVDAIVQRAVATAKKTRAAIRLPLNSFARMVISVADTDGSILALYRMPDATIFSIDVSVAKSRNVVYFSGAGIGGALPANHAVSNRTIGFGAQPFFPPGIDSGVFNAGPGPWYQSLFVFDLAHPCTQGNQPLNPNQNGVVFFAGSSPLYRGTQLIGGLGVSGDGIEQDDYVTYFGAGEFLPAQTLWADQVTVDGVRLPMFKFPRQPEGVKECGGGPCS
ncbi:MAG TPA: heme-binding protein [Thermoanaerobaculia bacterium]|nr:heme-binding protein [Thermoanaerobaculia bacterium]